MAHEAVRSVSSDAGHPAQRAVGPGPLQRAGAPDLDRAPRRMERHAGSPGRQGRWRCAARTATLTLSTIEASNPEPWTPRALAVHRPHPEPRNPLYHGRSHARPCANLPHAGPAHIACPGLSGHVSIVRMRGHHLRVQLGDGPPCLGQARYLVSATGNAMRSQASTQTPATPPRCSSRRASTCVSSRLLCGGSSVQLHD